MALQLQKEPFHRIQLSIFKIPSKDLSLEEEAFSSFLSIALDKDGRLANTWEQDGIRRRVES